MEAPPLTGTEVERTSVKRDDMSFCITTVRVPGWFVLSPFVPSVAEPLYQPSYAGLGALDGSAILHTLPASMQSTVMNAYKGTVN